MVEDDTTGLVWEAGFSELVDYAAAEQYCGDLNLAGMRFRVPTRIELASILDYSGVPPAISPAAFPKTPAAQFWHRPIHGRSAASIDLSDLSSGFGDSHVRCVAEAADASPMGPHYSLEGDTFVDLKTNLRWQRNATPPPPGGTAWSEPGSGSFDLADAHRYCAELELDGERDWRVPSVLELLSLVRPNTSQPSSDASDYVHLDPSVVPAETLEQAIFYSQTLFGAENVPWIVDFERDNWPASYGFSARRTLCVAGR